MTIDEIDKKLDELAKVVCNLSILRGWMREYDSGEGFEDFPLDEIRVNPHSVDSSFCEMGARDWFIGYYADNSPVLDDELNAYRKVHSWLAQHDPSEFNTVGNCRSMDLLSCSIWVLITSYNLEFESLY